MSGSWMTGEILAWKADANLFVESVMGVTPDLWQRRALTLVSKPETRRLAMKACKGPGKTALLAWIILWFLTCHYESKVGCTSITEGNIDTNLWPELLKWMNRSTFLKASFTWTKSSVTRKGNENWFAVKRTWPKTATPEAQADALAGIHADDVMFVLDESGGIPQAVMVTAEAVLSTYVIGHRALVIQAGNPTHTTGPLYRACTIDAHLWAIIRITGDPDDPERSPRISLEWAREEIAKYGRDNPWVKVNVLGEFPEASINALLSLEEVTAAMQRKLRPQEYEHMQKRLGVDVARFGDDRTVIFPRQGLYGGKPVIMRGARTTDIAARVMMGMKRWNAELALVDDTGHWGHGVIDNLHTAGVACIGINYAGKALNPRYRNKRAEMWITGAESIRGGASLPNLPEMVGELTEPTYSFVNGVFVLEDKDQVKERLGRSPDLADAYMTTYALEDMPGELMERLRGSSKTRHDADPYASAGQAERDFDPYN